MRRDCIGLDERCCRSFVFYDELPRRNIYMYTLDKVKNIRLQPGSLAVWLYKKSSASVPTQLLPQ